MTFLPCCAMKEYLHVCYFFSVTMDDVEAQQDFDDFFEEVFCEIEDKVTLLSCFPFSASTGQTNNYFAMIFFFYSCCKYFSPEFVSWKQDNLCKKYLN